MPLEIRAFSTIKDVNMGRRIFSERGFNLDGKVLSFEEFKPFSDTGKGIEFDEEQRLRLIYEAEKALEAPIPQLYASDYMKFTRIGNRGVFDRPYQQRRTMAQALAIGEYLEKKGRFLDKMIDVIWLLLEETSWVISAHNWKPGEGNVCLPYIYKGDANFIDLFSGWTGAALATVYRLCYDDLNAVSSIITERIEYELERRIIKPFLNDCELWDTSGWSGFKGNKVNNWNPWIVSNVLTVTAFTVKDLTTRTVIARKALPILDSFTETYHPDGGCDEGPGYWNVAGGALFGACLVLYDMTGGYVNVFDDPLLKNMGEYAVKAVVSKKRSLNFADASSVRMPDPSLLYVWGSYCNSDLMKQYAAWKQDGELLPLSHDQRQPYRELRLNLISRLPRTNFKPLKNFYIGGLEIAASREYEELDKGLYIALKGGNNKESHNHNDIGNIIVFSDGKPIFIDAGSGGYTRRTFSSERYTIWSMRSDHHNCATVNGVVQEAGAKFRSKNTEYDPHSGKMKLDLTEAYPETADIEYYSRSAELKDSVVIIEDDLTLKKEGSVTFNFLVRVAPTDVCSDSFTIEGRKVSFDPSLEYGIETLDTTYPEVESIPKSWETENMYRITLSSKNPFASRKFVLTIN